MDHMDTTENQGILGDLVGGMEEGGRMLDMDKKDRNLNFIQCIKCGTLITIRLDLNPEITAILIPTNNEGLLDLPLGDASSSYPVLFFFLISL